MNARQEFDNPVKCAHPPNSHVCDVALLSIPILLTKKGLAQKNYQVS